MVQSVFPIDGGLGNEDLGRCLCYVVQPSGASSQHPTATMTPEEAIDAANQGQVLPIYLVLGEETYTMERVVSALRRGALGKGPAGFNEEKLTAGETDADRIISAARMVPMMSPRRFISVRSIDRWDNRPADEDGPATSETDRKGALDRLADYAQSPVSSTCLVLVGSKIDGRRKLMTVARKGGWLVSCDPLPRAALPAFIIRVAAERGHPLASDVAELLAEISGPELSSVADALERLSLYVGQGQPITEDAIATCLVRVRQSTVWELLNAVGRRELGTALLALEDVYDPRDRGLRLIGLLAWSLRQLIKFDAATRSGAGPEDAARRAGAPPFKGRELAGQLRRLRGGELESWLLLLSEADLQLKGSKRPARATVEDVIMRMCEAASPS
jgi:DNA polymerase-3 subunit delta